VSIVNLRRDFDGSQFGLVRKRSDFDSSGSMKHKRVCVSVWDQSEQGSQARSVRFNVADVFVCGLGRKNRLTTIKCVT